MSAANKLLSAAERLDMGRLGFAHARGKLLRTRNG
jgi:hypothetical protein